MENEKNTTVDVQENEKNTTVDDVQEKQENAEKTFTQSQLNAIVADRLSREREKYAGFDVLKEKAAKFDEIEAANKTELEKATERVAALQKKVDEMTAAEKLRGIREEVSKKTGVPANLLTGSSLEDCETQAQNILEFAKPAGYPVVHDAGETSHAPTGKTRDQFAEWMKNFK